MAIGNLIAGSLAASIIDGTHSCKVWAGNNGLPLRSGYAGCTHTD